MDEVEWIVHPNGHIEGYSNWQGVLNNAYRLEGRNSLLTTLRLNRARLLFECVTMTMIEAAERLYEFQRQTTVHIQHYATLPGVGCIDIGMGPNLVSAKESCQDARRVIMLCIRRSNLPISR